MKRRERTRQLIELGGLIAKAGIVDLVDDDRAVIFGGCSTSRRSSRVRIVARRSCSGGGVASARSQLIKQRSSASECLLWVKSGMSAYGRTCRKADNLSR